MKKVSFIGILVFAMMAIVQAADKPARHSDRSGITIFKRSAPLKPSEKIKVTKVTVVQETDYSIIVDVSYAYRDDTPAEEVKLFVLPDMPYWTSNPSAVGAGRNVGRVSIDLHGTKMKEDNVDQYETSKLTISFDHYSPGKFKGSIFQQIVPFKKIWKAGR